LLIDCGASSLIAMRRLGIDPSTIGAIVVTHLHGDHFAGIPFVILDGQFGGRTSPLTIAGPPGTQARIESAMEVLFPGSTKVMRQFQVGVVELASQRSTSLEEATVTPFHGEHASGAPPFAVRIAYGGKIVSYSGDTQWTDVLLKAADGADLFIAEAYFFERQIKYHLDYRTLQAHRVDLGCRRLVLTHLSGDMLKHRS